MQVSIIDTKCSCEEKLSLDHILNEPCNDMKIDFKNSLEYGEKEEVYYLEFLSKHQRLGWEPAKLFCRDALNSRHAILFDSAKFFFRH